jgi:hypothetical protein
MPQFSLPREIVFQLLHSLSIEPYNAWLQ